LGGVEAGRRNVFAGVDFSRADLRQTAYKSAEFSKCRFVDTKLAKVDFQGSVFADCKFEGEMYEVAFHRSAFEGDGLPPNKMTRVDLSEAILRSVEFRELDMDTVIWPQGEEHLVLRPCKAALDRALGMLQARSDMPAKDGRLSGNLSEMGWTESGSRCSE